MDEAAHFRLQQKNIDQALENIESNDRLLQFIQLLHKINQREKIVNFEPDGKRNSDYSG